MDAAGIAIETVDLPHSATLSVLKALLVDRHGAAMARVLSVAAFIVDSELTRDLDRAVGPRIDVLPPFAGG
ncbi:MoaD/ThiS family protein [Rhodococcus koreensis]|nr:molybdopterin synthase sulfur carrier subunit [Rhodococcus koreensis]